MKLIIAQVCLGTVLRELLCLIQIFNLNLKLDLAQSLFLTTKVNIRFA